MENPIEPVPSPESEAIAPPKWSQAARVGFLAAVVLGAAALFYGITLLSEPYFPFELIQVLEPSIGVTLIFVGAVLGLQALRWLISSTPDSPYKFGKPSQARWLLIFMWLAGMLLPAQSLSDLKSTFVTSAAIGLGAAGAGALWLVRRFAIKLDDAWPPWQGSNAIRRRPRELGVFYAFVWGIVSTLLAIRLELVLIELSAPYLESKLRFANTEAKIIEALIGDPNIIIGVIVVFVVIAPLIEEVCKALGLLIFRGSIHTHSNGLLLGFAAGLGFGFIESAGYIALTTGSSLIIIAIWLRVATMWMHSFTTSLTGAGYARARLTGNRRALWSGLFRAIVVHGAWNGAAVLIVVSGVISPSGCLGIVALVLVVIVALRVLPRIATAAVDKAIQDDYAAAGVALPQSWSPIEEGVWWRLVGGEPKFPQREDMADAPTSAKLE